MLSRWWKRADRRRRSDSLPDCPRQEIKARQELGSPPGEEGNRGGIPRQPRDPEGQGGTDRAGRGAARGDRGPARSGGVGVLEPLWRGCTWGGLSTPRRQWSPPYKIKESRRAYPLRPDIPPKSPPTLQRSLARGRPGDELADFG